MNSEIQISFVVPVFGTEQYLPECIESILSDTTVKTEIIIVDDCSPGDCQTILKRYPTVKYIKHSVNKSSYQARISGLKEATGKYTCFIDSDDYFSNTDFKTLFEQLEETKADIAIFSSKTSSSNFTICDVNALTGTEEIIKSLCNGKFRWNLCDKIFRTTTLKSTLSSDFDEAYTNLAEDFCLFACVCTKAHKLIKAKSKTEYFYRTNQESITNQTSITIQTVLKHLASYRTVRGIVLNYYSKQGISRDLINQLDRKYSWNIGWYYENFIKTAGLDKDEMSSMYEELLESFNKAHVVEYLIKADYPNFAQYLANKPRSNSTVKRIAIVVSSLCGGGTERVAVCLADIFYKLGYFVHFITRQESKTSFDYSGNIPITIVSGDLKERIRGFESVAIKNGIDTFLFVDYYLYQTMDEIVAMKAFGYNVIAMEHNSFFVPCYVNEIALFSKRLLAYEVADALTCLSPMDLEAWKNSGIDNVHFIQNPIPFGRDKVKSSEKKENAQNVIFVGRLVYQKGVDFIPKIIHLVSKRYPDVKFQICGVFPDSSTEGNFKNSLKQFNVEDNVELLGFVTDTKKIFSHARVLFLPSRFEGLPMVLLEAKEFGVPSVIFEMPYLVSATENEGCVQVPFGDCVEMAKAICRILKDDTLHSDLSKKAVKSLNDFRDDIIVKKWLSLFETFEHPAEQKVKRDSSSTSQLIMREFHKSIISLSPNLVCSVPEFGLYGKFIEVIERFFPPFSTRRKLLKQAVVRFIRIADSFTSH